MSASPYRLAQAPEAAPAPTVPWYRYRPVWWRKILWRYTRTRAAQHQPRRQTLGGRWVLVYEHQTNKTSHHWCGGTRSSAPTSATRLGPTTSGGLPSRSKTGPEQPRSNTDPRKPR